jgi:hypothetical protein
MQGKANLRLNGTPAPFTTIGEKNKARGCVKQNRQKVKLYHSIPSLKSIPKNIKTNATWFSR